MTMKRWALGLPAAFLALFAIVLAGDVQVEVISWEKGLNLRDAPEVVGGSYMVGNSYNFYPNGATLKKRGGIAYTTEYKASKAFGGNIFLDGRDIKIYEGDHSTIINGALGNAVWDSTSFNATNAGGASYLWWKGITFDDKAYLVIPRVAGTTDSGIVWVYNLRDQWWSKISRYTPIAAVYWGISFDSYQRRTLYYYTGGAAYKMTDSTWDRGAENRVAITAQAITGAFGLGTWSKYMRFEMPIENSDSIRVSLTYTTKLATNKPRTSTELVAAFGPGTGDTTSVGQVHVKSIDLKQREGYTAQITIWASGTGRCIIHPCRLIYERNPL